MITDSVSQIYKIHHANNRPTNFSLLELDRAKLLQEFIGVNKKILDIGCRDGTLTKYFIRGNKVTGVDIDANALGSIRKNLGVHTIIMDLNGDWGELGKEKFDVVVAGEVLEHLYNPDKVLKKIVNRLNDNGLFIGSVPNAFSLKHRLRYLMGSKKHTPLSDPTHINHFSYGEFKNLLRSMFESVHIIGLGRYKFLSKTFPNLASFDLFFKAEIPLINKN